MTARRSLAAAGVTNVDEGLETNPVIDNQVIIRDRAARESRRLSRIALLTPGSAD